MRMTTILHPLPSLFKQFFSGRLLKSLMQVQLRKHLRKLLDWTYKTLPVGFQSWLICVSVDQTLCIEHNEYGVDIQPVTIRHKNNLPHLVSALYNQLQLNLKNII